MLGLVLRLADDPALDPTTGRGPEWGKAAPIALLIILLMGIALFLLIRSMNSQLRKVPSAFLRGETTAAAPAATEPDPTTRPDDAPAGADAAPPGDNGSTPRP
jgi:hypothetical protein